MCWKDSLSLKKKRPKSLGGSTGRSFRIQTYRTLEITGLGAICGNTDKSPAEKEPNKRRLMPAMAIFGWIFWGGLFVENGHEKSHNFAIRLCGMAFWLGDLMPVMLILVNLVALP